MKKYLEQVQMLSEDSNMTQNQLVHINISYYRNKKYKPFATQQVRVWGWNDQVESTTHLWIYACIL